MAASRATPDGWKNLARARFLDVRMPVIYMFLTLIVVRRAPTEACRDANERICIHKRDTGEYRGRMYGVQTANKQGRHVIQLCLDYVMTSWRGPACSV